MDVPLGRCDGVVLVDNEGTASFFLKARRKPVVCYGGSQKYHCLSSPSPMCIRHQFSAVPVHICPSLSTYHHLSIDWLIHVLTIALLGPVKISQVVGC